MPCYALFDQEGKRIGWIRGRLGPHCRSCGGVGEFLCDFPVGANKTCDCPMCGRCRKQVAPGIDYCAGHHAEWMEFRAGGGVNRELENVLPFKQPELF